MLAIECRLAKDAYDLRLLYRERTYARQLVRQLARHLARVIAGFWESETPVARLRLLDQSEAALILKHSSGETRPYPLEQPLSRLFDAQVRRTPNRIALIDEGEDGSAAELTYQQLARRVQISPQFDTNSTTPISQFATVDR